MASSSLSKAVPKVSLIECIHDGTDRWRIVARILRKWSVYQKEHPTELFCISMLLVDEIGNKIQASVMNKGLFDRYLSGAIEGKTYFIANFVVSPNTKEYRATNHPFRMTLGPQTYIKELEGAIADYSYSFMPISQIRQVDEKDHVDYLIDVIGYVKSIEALEEYRVNGETKNRLRMVLADEEGLIVNCVLYDECAVKVCMASIGTMVPPVVMILQLARVGFNDEGLPEVCSSFNATKVSLNEKCPEVKHFIQSSKFSPSPVISSDSHVVPNASRTQSPSAMLRSHRRIKISDLPKQNMDAFFLLHCEVAKLDTRYGWMYDGCNKCGSKPKYENNKLMCMLCKKTPVKIEPKFKVHYTVSDETGKASVVFFDKLAVQLIGNTALELKIKLDKEDRAYDFPDELDGPIGTNILLKLKLNKYNVDFPNSSISVSSYTICTNLMSEFNASGKEVEDGVPSQIVEEARCVVVEVTDSEGSAPEVTPPSFPDPQGTDSPGLDDLPISQVIPKPAVKGKRKHVWKKVAAIDENGGPAVIPSPTKLPPKTVKTIKQEKI